MDTRTKDNIKTALRVSCMAFAMLLVLVLLTGVFWGSKHLVVQRHVIFYDNLPGNFDGYRILQVSDIHVGTFRDGGEDFVRKIVNTINEQRCDLVVFTGDMVNRQSSELDGMNDVFSAISAKDGVFCILGNHDYATYSKLSECEQKSDVDRLLNMERGFGWKPLCNEHVRIYRGKQYVVLAGVENYGAPPFPQYGDIFKALKGVTRNDFVVLLSHDPSHWRMQVVPNTSVQLTLSGHTHAGQFKVWGWSPVAWKYDEWSGIYKKDTQVLNVSEGVGGFLGPFRFGAWPELSVITLRRIPSGVGRNGKR